MEKIYVDEDTCIGCGFCCASSEVFEMNDDGRAVAKENEINDSNKEELTEIKEGCPVGAIKIEEK